MDWKFSGSRPVYRQIMETLCDAVLAGDYSPGDRIPSVRELAAEAQVNPNTMQRALAELEREGLLVSSGTMGRCVTADQTVLERMRNQKVAEVARACAEQFKALGLTVQEAAALLLKMEEKTEE